jgi:acetyl/propionyl-CoA carboxylase alpha subunit
MFNKLLIANRGEIAVRVIRACHDLGVATVALYEPADRHSLHVRLADECLALNSPAGFMDGETILALARQKGAQAIHPGYGFLAEEARFIDACAAAGLAFVGPPAGVVRRLRDKIGALQEAAAAGFPTVNHSPVSFDGAELDAIRAEANRLGYPLIVKSCSGGRGPAARLVARPEKLGEAVRHAGAVARAVYGSGRLYLERAIPRAHQVAVQIVGDSDGRLVHLGEREGSIIRGHRKLVEESPAPGLSLAQRRRLWQAALELGRLFGCQNAASVEFILDQDGDYYFTEIKARIQVEHPVTEIITRLDLVREQIRLAAGYPLLWRQEDIRLPGAAVLFHLRAEDPAQHYGASPGFLRHTRLPDGPGIRTDTYVSAGVEVPASYDPLLAKITAWAEDRPTAINRLARALAELRLDGVATNLAQLQAIVRHPAFVEGAYDTSFLGRLPGGNGANSGYLADLAAIAAVLLARRDYNGHSELPERLSRGWHRESRRLPGG